MTPRAGRCGIVPIDAQVAVDPGSHPAADGDDFVVVPVALLDELFAALGFQEGAAVLFVELAPPAGADVGLVALHLAACDRLAADLDAAVPFVVDELHVERQAEVADRQLADQELVLRRGPPVLPTISPFSTVHSLASPTQPVRSLPLKKRADVVGGGEHRRLPAGAAGRRRASGLRAA